MNESILACRINGEDVYFIKRPQSGEKTGFIRKEIGDP